MRYEVVQKVYCCKSGGVILLNVELVYVLLPLFQRSAVFHLTDIKHSHSTFISNVLFEVELTI